MLVDEINGIINSDNFSRSYDNLYFDVTFSDTEFSSSSSGGGGGGGSSLFQSCGCRTEYRLIV